MELDPQLNARINRTGQTDRVIINRLVACGTIEDDVVKSLKSKDNRQDGLLVALKARIQKYSGVKNILTK